MYCQINIVRFNLLVSNLIAWTIFNAWMTLRVIFITFENKVMKMQFQVSQIPALELVPLATAFVVVYLW